MPDSSQSESTHLLSVKAFVQQAETQLAQPAARQPAGGWRPYRSLLFFVAGLLILQGVGLLVTFGLLAVGDPPPGPPDAMAALDIPASLQQPSLQAEPPPPPTATPFVKDIFERHSVAAPVEVSPTPAAPPPVVQWRGVEITQGIQVFQEPENARCHPHANHPDHIFCNNAMPMVAGRHTLVRAYLACTGACPTTEITVRLRVRNAEQAQTVVTQHLPADTLTRVTHLSMYELRASLDNSVNFEFFPPPGWMSGPIIFELEAMVSADPQQPVASLSLSKDFAVRNPLRIAYLPIEYNGLRPPNPAEADYWLRRLYPVAEVEYYRLPVPDIEWDGDVSKSEVLRKLLYTYWFYAQFNPNQPRPDQLFGWLPQELYNGGASDPFWCPNCAGPHSSRVAFGGLRPEQDIGGPRILAHEIAHNLGALHAWSPTEAQDPGCFRAAGADIKVDPAWPYAETPHIQEFGVDLYSNPPQIYPPTIYDMMAYCTNPWISPHTYQRLFDSPFLQAEASDFLTYSDFQPQLESGENGTLLVSGVVYPDGTVSKPEIIKLEGDAFGGAFLPPLKFTPPPGDDYCLEVRAKDDSRLARHCFDVGFTDLETGRATEPSPYFFTLPQLDTAKVNRVALSKNRVEVMVATPSNHPPEVTITYPNGGESLSGRQTVTWESADADGDNLQYDLLYSPDNGQSWLPLATELQTNHYSFDTGQVQPGPHMYIRVIASDGFHTAVDESNGPFALKPPPENSLSLVGPAQVKPGQRFEVDIVAQRVTEPGLFGVQFELIFDPSLVQVDDLWPNSALAVVAVNTIENEAGRVTLAASRQGQVDNLTGDITLTTLTFTAGEAEGQLELYLQNVVAGNRSGQEISLSPMQALPLILAE